MRVLLLLATAVLSGCAAMEAVIPAGGDAEGRAMSAASAAPARTSSGGSTRTVGLPLSRKGKIGLWAGVAVFLAYLMHSDGEPEVAGSGDP
jgi:hypothetical protein